MPRPTRPRSVILFDRIGRLATALADLSEALDAKPEISEADARSLARGARATQAAIETWRAWHREHGLLPFSPGVRATADRCEEILRMCEQAAHARDS